MKSSCDKINTKPIGDKLKIYFPNEFKSYVSFIDELRGESVHWNYEKNARVAVISNKKLEEDRYVHIKQSEVMEGGTHIRPPKELINAISRPISKGRKVVYLSHEEMSSGETRSVYFLTESQALDLVGESSTSNKDLESILYNTPRFLPIPE